MGKKGGHKEDGGLTGLGQSLTPFFVSPDVDECSSGKHRCDNSTVCVNTGGSYTCHCRQGWVPKPGFRDKQMTTICEGTCPALTPGPTHNKQALSQLMNCCPVPCRDRLPCLDCSPWNQEPGEWPQQGPAAGNPSSQLTLITHFPQSSPIQDEAL